MRAALRLLPADLLRHDGDGESGDAQTDPEATEAEAHERSGDEHQGEGHAPWVGSGRDHPERGRDEIGDDQTRRRGGEREQAAARGLRGPAVDDRPEQESEGDGREGDDDEAAQRDPADARG
ncbi:MAG TPA: hypothetical protein VGE98_11435, partial [Thermoanaerobaculia bacterium]